MTVEELEEKLSFCEEDDEIKVVLTYKGKYITADIEDLEFYDRLNMLRKSLASAIGIGAYYNQSAYRETCM